VFQQPRRLSQSIFFFVLLTVGTEKDSDMKTVKELQAAIQDQHDRVAAILNVAKEESRDLSADEEKEIDELQGKGDQPGKIGELEAKLDRMQKVEAAQKSIARQRFAGVDAEEAVSANGELNVAAVKVPAKAKAAVVKSFTGPNADKEAYIAGQFVLSLQGNESAKSWLANHGIQNAMSTSDNTKGGYLVPEVMESAIIRNVEEYGVARREARVYPMGSGPVLIPRRASGFTGYFAGENSSVTASDLAFDQIRLEARKLMVFSSWSSELPEDSVVALGDLLTMEVAQCFAVKEDQCLFLGDGTNTYGGIVGLANALAAGAVATTASNIDTPAEITIASFEEAMGKLLQLPGLQPKWYCHSSIYHNVMQRLGFASTGNTAANFNAGFGPTFLGYPVVFCQGMDSGAPTTDLSGKFIAYFGDMSRAVTMGQKRGISIAVDNSYGFNTDSIYFRATERFDINVHERGTTTVGGPVVGVKCNAS
jgi:HK97 family phage major capsid protein